MGIEGKFVPCSLGFYLSDRVDLNRFSLLYGEVNPGTGKGGYYSAIKISGLALCIVVA